MKKVLFLIHDLGQGGAEKVLINLVNNMDKRKYNITVMALFADGVNEQFLSKEVRYITCFDKTFPANSHLMKLLSPKQLHKALIKEKYDIEISYLEGPCARIISGCDNPQSKLVTWNHCNYFSLKELTRSYRGVYEIKKCYDCFHSVICVSQFMKENLCGWLPIRDKCQILYNTIDSKDILRKSSEETSEIQKDEYINLISVGSLKEIKGFDRLLRIIKRLKVEGYLVRLYLLGKGPLENEIKNYIEDNLLFDEVRLLGYKTNPYKYVAKCDLFVCSSYSEGFSTAVTESLIVGTPVCTVDVSGMKEMLGDHNEYGLITENNEEALYQGIKELVESPELLEKYRTCARIRGKYFDKEATVKATEDFLMSLMST